MSLKKVMKNVVGLDISNICIYLYIFVYDYVTSGLGLYLFDITHYYHRCMYYISYVVSSKELCER